MLPCPSHPRRVLLVVALLAVPLAAAAQPDVGSIDAMIGAWQSFKTTLDARLTAALADPTYFGMARIFLVSGIVIAIILGLAQWVAQGFDLADILYVVFMILATNLLFNLYPTLTSAAWGAAEGLGDALQGALLGGDSSFFTPLQYFYKLVTATIFDISVLDAVAPTVLAYKILAAVVVMILGVLLVIMAIVASIFGLWGFALAKLIGLIFVPLILFPRLGFIFDGWVRFALGFLLYTVIARVNIAIAALAVGSFYGVGYSNNPEVSALVLDPDSLYEIIGLIGFLVVSISALFLTGRFVGQIIIGQNIALSGGLSRAAGAVAGLAKGG